MNPSTALATVLVDELVRGGLREAVLAPGSRSAPLAFALYDADQAGRLRLHVRIDERSAGFLALGLAKATGDPVAVITTSGTAAVNLHPAVVEASYAGIPLLAVTADRPPELRGVGANQTIDQRELFGKSVRMFADVAPAADGPGPAGQWRDLMRRAMDATAHGPVHLNVAFREPLVPDGDDSGIESGIDSPIEPLATNAPIGADAAGEPDQEGPIPEQLPARGVVVLGAGAGSLAASAHSWARSVGWPVLAQPGSGGRRNGCIGSYPLLLAADDWRREHRADVVLVVGRPTIGRALPRFIREAAEHWVVDPKGRWLDPVGTARLRLPALPSTHGAPWPDRTWRKEWERADGLADDAVDALLRDRPLCGPSVARTMLAAVPSRSLLVVGASQPVRDLDAYSRPRSQVRILANRGASGIDGTVSTAVGAALVHEGPAYALMGDLTFLHDANGLVIGPGEPRPDLTVVVNNDNGGGIFHLLEQGGPSFANQFERIFGTPHGVDLSALCAASGTGHTVARSAAELAAALASPDGLRVVEVRTDRAVARDLHERLRESVATALSG